MNDRFPKGAYIEDGLVIVGDEAFTPLEWAGRYIGRGGLRSGLTKAERTRLNVRLWRQRHPERNRELARQYRARKAA